MSELPFVSQNHYRMTRMAALSQGFALAVMVCLGARVASGQTRSLSSTAQGTQAPPLAPAASPAPPVDTPAVAEARERQRRGRALLEAGNANAALAEFQRVYDLMAGTPRQFIALSNMGRCYQMLGEYDRAMEYYQRYLDEGDPQAEARSVVEASIIALNDLLGSLEITVAGPPGAEVWVDNHRVRRAPGTVRVAGGRHTIELREDGWTAQRREVQLIAHQTVPLRFVLSRPRGGPSPVLFGVGAGIAALTLVAGGVVGTVALVTRANIDAQLSAATPGQFLVAGEPADRAPIRDEALAADVCYGIGGAFAIGTVILAFVTDWSGPHRASIASPPRALVLPLATPRAVGLGFVTTF
ncbi:MAG: tetratricopeptide repeat protein [Deltaproteobacteria bacterium]